MDAIGRIAATAAAAAGQGDLAPGLALGRAVQARVQQMLADGVYRLLTPTGPLRLESATPLPVGATVTLTLAQTPEGPQIRLAVQGAPVAAPAEGRPASSGPTAPVILPPADAQARPAAPPTPAGQLARGFNPVSEPLAPPALFGIAVARPTPELRPATPAAVAAPPPAVKAAGGTVPPPASAPQPGPPAPAVLRTPLAQAISDALKVQDGLAPLLAGLARAAVGGPEREKAAAAKGIELIRALALDVSGPAPDGAALRQALQRSGVLLEHRLAVGEPPGPRGDLKAVLLGLREALPGPPGEPSEAAPAAVRQPPPGRGAPPAPPSLPMPGGGVTADAPLGELVRAALARITLQQAVSLPGAPEAAPAERAPPPLHATLPIALPGGLALAELVVEREPRGRGDAEAAARAWRVWVALDAEPHGPVTALVSFGRERGVGVTFWAERPGAAEALAAELDALRASLLAAELGVGELAARAGAPRERPGAGLRLDRTS
jgi:hypothetical protein